MKEGRGQSSNVRLDIRKKTVMEVYMTEESAKMVLTEHLEIGNKLGWWMKKIRI